MMVAGGEQIEAPPKRWAHCKAFTARGAARDLPAVVDLPVPCSRTRTGCEFGFLQMTRTPSTSAGSTAAFLDGQLTIAHEENPVQREVRHEQQGCRTLTRLRPAAAGAGYCPR